MHEHRRTIGIIAAALLLGLAVWWALGRGRLDAVAADDHAPPSADARTPLGSSTRRASAKPDLQLAAKAAISGTVRDLDDRPIAGAQVCASPEQADLDGRPAGPPRCAKTGDDGHYRLEGLLPIRVRLGAQARGHLPQRWQQRDNGVERDLLELRPGQTRDGVDFRLPGGGVSISGVVRDVSGGEIEGAWVTAWSGGRPGVGPSVAWTDAEGRFEVWVAPHQARLEAAAEGYASGAGFGTSVAAPSEHVELRLTPESVLVGRVVLHGTAEPIAGVRVSASASGFFAGDDMVGRSDEQGRFRIAKLAPGIYDLVATGDELYGEAGEQVHLALAQTSDEVVIELHPARLVSGLVRYAGVDGKPCDSGRVGLRERADSSKAHSAEVRPGGEVELPGVLPGTYAVSVTCEGAVSEDEYPDVEVADASVAGLVWEVREGQAIAGEVVDHAGQPLAGARVYAVMQARPDDPRGQQSQRMSAETLADGQFRVAGLLPGRYKLNVWADRPGDPEPLEVELEPGADRNDVRIQLPASATVTGQVRDARGTPLVGVRVRGTSIDRPAYVGAVSDEQGRFVIEHAPLGPVRFIASEGMTDLRAPGTSDDDQQGVVHDVVAGGANEVELVVEAQTGRITGRVLDEGGAPVADAFVSHRRMSDSAAASTGSSKRSLRWDFYDEPVLTDVDGRFVVEGLADDASYALGAFRKGGGEALLDAVRPGEDVELTIVATGELAGRLVVEGGPAPERAVLTLVEPNDGLRRVDELFRTGGAFRFRELPPGTYTISVDSSAGSAELTDVTLAAGEVIDDLVVTLTPRVTVRGRLVDIDTREPIAGMAVFVGARKGGRSIASSDPDEKHISDSDGRFERTDARTGKVTITIRPRNWGGDNPYGWLSLPRVLPSDEPIVDLGEIELIRRRVADHEKAGDLGFTLAHTEPDAEAEDWVATVAVVRPGGPAEAAGLVVGDVIEAIDGHDIRGVHSSRFYTLTAVPPGTQVTLRLADEPEVTITAGAPLR